MSAPELLLQTLEDLFETDFEKLKFFLSMKILDGCDPIPKSRLETKSRIDIARRMIESYGDDKALRLTKEILSRMNCNQAAGQLESACTGGEAGAPPSTSSSPAPAAAPAGISAGDGSVIIAPTLGGNTTSGSWNITINK